ncbi:MAG: rhomboid family intramembrane serine protease [Pyrinomonadaceae bacterium]
MSIQNVREEIDQTTGPEPVEIGEELAGRGEVPVPWYTYTFVICILAVTVAQLATDLDGSILAAGFVKPEFARGEYWRILTGATAHGGLAHAALNGYALYSFGRIFELLSNRAHLAIVMLIAAVAGGLLSFAFVPEGISVGASGGIVGLLSYLAVYAFKRYQFISPEFRRSLLINIGFIILFGLALYQLIDNWGHIGGLIAGAVYGFVQIPRDPYVDPAVASPATQVAGVICLGAYIAASIFSILLILKWL